ncbi:hypothetical protein C9J48_00190 [Photobacterium profundum]|uniref:Lipoprotein n=1 Tax=Photobacterium profundum 3TCK TaxID=314280 RepID=Q1Z1Y8_9GAMM|nr:hypothetical protein [Photobacterium profundum]EAS42525.1 hypothetical protein P3TCK_19090 [Photobacterium profundum 3TCK]PSV63930.1 hypothetical protein C9J48_00190 [Photobacterium profundum]
MKNLFLIIPVVFLLIGCGGGGGDDASTSNPDSPADSAAVNDESSAKFESLVVPDGFNFKSSYPVSIIIDLNETETMFLSVYGKYSIDATGTPVPDANSRIVAGEIKNGNFKGTITATSQLKSLLIEAWYVDSTQEPFRETVSLPAEQVNITN